MQRNTGSGPHSRSQLECGFVRGFKALLHRYPDTHFAIGKWATPLDPFLERVERAVHPVDRSAPVDLLAFSDDSADRFINEQDTVDLSFADVDWIRVGNAEALT